MTEHKRADHSTLSWVRKELDETLHQAVDALETYSEQRDDRTQLQFCATHLHQVQGILQMLELFGPGMLVEEAERLAVFLLEDDGDPGDDVLEALMRAILQVPDYLEQLQHGAQDLPILLLPLLNDLRAARGASLLTESSLFSPDLNASREAPRNDAGVDEDVAKVARKLRYRYQRSLLGYLRNEQVDENLTRMLTILEHLDTAAGDDQAGTVWWVGAGVVEALRDQGLESSPAVKSLLGQVDRQMKRAVRDGSSVFAVEPPRDLIKNLLYYVGRAEPKGDRVGAIQKQYDLKGLLLDDRQIEEARAGAFGPSSEILATVAAAIKEDLANVKDTLDLYTRQGSDDRSFLSELPDALGRIADTLGVLGLGVPRAVVREQRELLQQIVDGDGDATEDALMGVAEALLLVESAVDSLSGEVRDHQWMFRDDEGSDDESADGQEELLDGEFRRVFGQAIDEAITDINRIKESVVRCIDGDEAVNLEELPSGFRSLCGALDMLGLDRAAEIVRTAERYLNTRIGSGEPMREGEDLDRLADAVTGVEYYLEAVREGRNDPEQILEVSASSLQALGFPLDSSAAEVEPTVENPVEVPTAETPAPEPEPVPESRKRRSMELQYGLPVRAEDYDPEIMEMFLEEAEELLATVREEYPRWRNDPEQTESLVTVRRMFHTFKGSGRLAGALRLGELAWATESLLNRILERTLEPDEPILAYLDDVVAVLPQFLLELQDEPAEVDADEFMRRAERLRDPLRYSNAQPEAAELDTDGVEAADIPLAEQPSAEPAEVAPAEDSVDFDLGGDIDALEYEEIELSGLAPEEEDETAAAQADVTDSGAPTPRLDPVLYEIFERETRGHLAVVREFLTERAAENDAPVPVSEPLQRALHTLAGSARMADLEPIASLARGLERYAEQLTEADEPMGPQGFDLLARGADLVEEVVRALGDERLPMPDAQSLLDELKALEPSEAESPVTSSVEPVMAEPAIDLEETAEVSVASEPVESDEPSEATEPGPAVERAEPIAPGSPTVPLKVAEPVETYEIDEDLVELFLEEAGDILAFLDSTMQRWEDAPDHGPTVAELHRSLHTLKGGARLAGFPAIANLCHALEGLTNDVAEHRVSADDVLFNIVHAALDRLRDLLAQARARESLASVDDLLERIAELHGSTAGPVPDDYEAPPDAELLEVFLEEAEEILSSTEASLYRWREGAGGDDLIRELQRALHTLKGGARMAGLQAIADLSHGLETFLDRVVAGEFGVAAAEFDVLERSHDMLFTARAAAVRGEALPDVDALTNELSAWRGSPPVELEDTADAEARQAAAADAPEAENDFAVEPEPEPQSEDAVADAGPALAPMELDPAPALPESGGPQDMVRVRADLLDSLVNHAGEISIYRARLDQQIGAMRFNLTELDQTVVRLREQLRTLDIETEAQILYRHEREHEGDDREDFDPLELDRFSRMQELSRGLGESVNDLVSIESLLDNLARESETLLLQQSRVNTDLQDGLMRSRMVPFANLVPRLRRIVRQTAHELGKQAQLEVLGAQGKMDRTVLERVVPPLEHMLRNAVAHGIEAPEAREAAGKPVAGKITVEFEREGGDVVIRVADDGAGIDLEAIRAKAVEDKLMDPESLLTDREVMQFILNSGFSTADSVTQIAGRGVGMDVVNAEIKQLGGALDIDSDAGTGSRFTIRLPFTLAINQALLCSAGDDVYAIPLSGIEGVVRITDEQLRDYLARSGGAEHHFGEQRYQVRSLSRLMRSGEPQLPGAGRQAPLVLLQAGEHRLALHVDTLLGSREIVVKSVGPQVSTVPGILGATILADGRVVLILDVSALARLDALELEVAPLAEGEAAAVPTLAETPEPEVPARPRIMVVDDSITMRKVATRLLERNGMDVLTAKDGVDAVALLQEHVPDAMLLDIEMPRMDGYELATHMRNADALRQVPIIMVTSRTGEKHRQRALDIGVDRYLGKPYQESDLLSNLRELLGAKQHGGD